MAEEIVVHAFKWIEHCSEILEEQQYIFDNSMNCDCVLVSTEGQRIGAHKVILSTVSDFLRKILEEQPAHIETTIHIPDADIHVLTALLTFMYVGEARVPSNKLNSLLELCNILDVKGFTKGGYTLNGDQTKSSSNSTNRIVEKKVQQSNESVPKSSRKSILMQKEYLDAPIVDENQLDMVFEESDAGGYTDYDVEYLDEEESLEPLKAEDSSSILDEEMDVENAANCITFEIDRMEDETANTSTKTAPAKQKRIPSQRSVSSQIDIALNEVSKGKTIHRLSVEYNVPRSTLYHRFRNDERLQQTYRQDRKFALEQAVRCVLDENLSLMKASERFKVPKTAIWREVRKFDQYNPTACKEVPEERQKAQEEIISGKSLTSISTKYGIPLTTLHRDKKKLSSEGKLPEWCRVRDRAENSEFNQRLEMALEKCRHGMSQYQAAKLYNIPKATMWRYAHTIIRADKKMEEEALEREAQN